MKESCMEIRLSTFLNSNRTSERRRDGRALCGKPCKRTRWAAVYLLRSQQNATCRIRLDHNHHIQPPMHANVDINKTLLTLFMPMTHEPRSRFTYAESLRCCLHSSMSAVEAPKKA